MSRNRQIEILENITIESIAAEGKAVAHSSDGIVIFVPFAVPGDIVDIKVHKKKSKYIEGSVFRIVKASKDRLEPFCPHFGLCGGCKWQPLPYGHQLEAKRQQVYDQLVRIGHLQVPEIRPTIGSEKTEYYRNKLDYTFSCRRWVYGNENIEELTPEQKCGLGFHVGNFFDKVIDIEDCHLQASPSNEIRLFCKKYALENGLEFYNLRENHGFLRNLIIRTSSSGEVMLIVVFAEDRSEEREAMLNSLLEAFPQITSLYYVVNSKLNDSIQDQECIFYHGNRAIYEQMENLRFKISPKSFYQTNSLQAYKLYCIAREFADLSGSETVYDLYTGTGTIAQFVSGKAGKVVGIEYVPEAIEDAKVNAAANGITNCTFFAGDMKDILTPAFIEENGRPDVIILDPPRAGIHPDVAKVILQAAPRKMVYVSCNPASQARDLAIFSQKYRITAVQPVDMFPHTQHVENVCSLELI